jgi:hypothetical protein
MRSDSSTPTHEFGGGELPRRAVIGANRGLRSWRDAAAPRDGATAMYLHSVEEEARRPENCSGNKLSIMKNLRLSAWKGAWFRSGRRTGLINVAAGCTVLGLLLLRWLPSAIREHGTSEHNADELTTLANIDG